MSIGQKMQPKVPNSQHKPSQQSARPQLHRVNLVQPKMAAAPQIKRPTAPPVYRPQPVPKVLQAKKSVANQPVNHPASTPPAPPVYRPQPLPKVLQPKMTGGKQWRVGQSSGQAIAPPVSSPTQKRIVDASKASALQPGQPPKRPQVYRPELKLLQPKYAQAAYTRKQKGVVQLMINMQLFGKRMQKILKIMTGQQNVGEIKTIANAIYNEWATGEKGDKSSEGRTLRGLLDQYTDLFRDAMQNAQMNTGHQISYTQPLVDLYNGVVLGEESDEATSWQRRMLS